MSLKEYQQKRDFIKTPEPAGKKDKGKSKWLYVIHKHDANNLHYDFRLELNGVLKSWAVPKGPSLDPAEKRLAVHVEDHPVEYAAFEGVIPEDEYGGGTVMIWDQGKWKPNEDAEEGYKEGKLKFELQGEKLNGGWMLVQMRGKTGNNGKNWLLIKEKDDQARSLKEGDILKEQPDSIESGRSIEQIAEDRDRVWPEDQNKENSDTGKKN